MILSLLNSPFESDAPLCGQELLHANNLPFLLPTRTSGTVNCKNQHRVIA